MLRYDYRPQNGEISQLATPGISPIRPIRPIRQSATCRARAKRRRVKASQTRSNPVKVFPIRYRRATIPAPITIYCGFPGQMHNPLRFAATAHTNTAIQSAIRVKPSQSQSKCFPNSTVWAGLLHAIAATRSATGQAPSVLPHSVLSDRFRQSALSSEASAKEEIRNSSQTQSHPVAPLAFSLST